MSCKYCKLKMRPISDNMRELNPRAWIPSLNRYATGFDDLYYHRQMNGEGEWWCYPAGEDEQLDVEIELPTGLKDKNGKEIYEGDIVKNTNGINETAVCIWDESNAELDFRGKDGKYTRDNVKSWLEMYEVIGNIHEQPELIEDKV